MPSLPGQLVELLVVDTMGPLHLAVETRRARAIAQPGVTVLGVAPLPFVERFPGNPEATAYTGDVSLVGRYGYPDYVAA